MGNPPTNRLLRLGITDRAAGRRERLIGARKKVSGSRLGLRPRGLGPAPFLGLVVLFLIFLRAEPLCMARWSVLSLSIKYCGSSFEAWTVYPLNVISEVIFFLIVPRTRPASEFHST